jgi:acyl-CoA synthetase (NDP forming)
MLAAGVDAAMVYCVDLFGAGADALLADAVLVAISPIAADSGKPVVASIIGRDGRPPTSGPQMVPNFRFPEVCATVLARAAERREWLARPLGQQPAYRDVDAAAARALAAAALERDGGAQPGAWLATRDAEALVATHGVDVIASVHAADVSGAVDAAAAIGGPIALKADLPPPADAGDVDAVLLGLAGESAIEAGWRELEHRVSVAGRQWRGAIVQPLARPGADVLVGAFTDPDLGPVMAVGLGGRQAGPGHTAAFSVLPATDVEADELIDSAEGVSMLLEGFRGAAKLDRDALCELVLRFALLVRSVPELTEADLNPVRCTASGCVVLDLRVRVGEHRAPERVKTW